MAEVRGMTKVCNKCFETKSYREFVTNGNRVRNTCRPCHAAYQRDYLKANPHQVVKGSIRAAHYRQSSRGFERQLLKDYGITLEEYNQMAARQDFRCAICGQDEAPLVVDHKHGARGARGLLCQPCNKGLGHFFDTPALLTAAAGYLRRSCPVSSSTRSVMITLPFRGPGVQTYPGPHSHPARESSNHGE